MSEVRRADRSESWSEFVAAVLAAAGGDGGGREIVAHEVVDAEARGYESQGVMRVPSYVAAARSGETVSPDRAASCCATRPRPSSGTPHHGWGHVAALKATHECATPRP